MLYNLLAMLKRLEIQNLAIIENVDVAFSSGFTCLTGGTGAGKSLVIDSLSLLLGARASSELIREGAEKATIRGTFLIASSRLRALLENLEIPSLNEELVIERVIGRNKNQIRANGVAISLGDLSKIAKHLADIHSQFDVIKILNPENYLEVIDGFRYDQTSRLKEDYAERLNEYRRLKGEYEQLLLDQKKLEENREFYEFQYKELKAFGLDETEEQEIEKELAALKNYDKVYALSKEAEEILNGDTLDHLYELNRLVNKLSDYIPSLTEEASILDDRYYELNDLFATIKKRFGKLDYDPDRLNELEQRSFDLASLKRKYKKDIPQLLDYLKHLDSLLGENNSLEDRIKEKEAALLQARHLAFDKGKELSLLRQSLAKGIEKEIERNLDDLLLHSSFKISFLPYEENEDCLLENGIDKVDFLIETNVGEGLRSLSKVVSGGEASRLMLAFKAIFIRANKIETVIFDEIDTGVSGEVASAVAAKIAEIALSSQVIAITHLPQVASYSNHHILISKSVKGGRTYTEIRELDLEGKILEIAHLISGGKITEKQLEYAKELVLSKHG